MDRSRRLTWATRPSARVLLLWAVVAAAYVVAAQTGFAFAFATKQVTAVWPPSGLALAALVLGGHRLWPGVLIGAFIANARTDEPVAIAVAIAAGNTLEAVVGAWFIRRVDGFRPALERTRDVLTLVCLAAFVSTAISATIGVAALGAGGIVNPADAVSVWRVWWLGDAGGDLLVAPVLLVYASLLRDRGWAAARPIAQSILAAGLLAGLGLVVFRSGEAIAYVLFPVVFAIALQLRQPGTTLGALSLAGVAVWETSHGSGQFAAADADVAMLRAQMYVGVLAFASLLLTAFRTEREQAESAEQAQRAVNRDLTAASEAKSRFLANVSHELRTPMTVVSGFAATLLTGRPGPLTPMQRDQLEAIRRSSEHLNALITDLLELARNEAGKTQLDVVPVDCSEFIGDVADEMRQLAADRGLRLELNASEPVVVWTDSRALRQILINLTGNAIKFTEAGHVRLGVTDDDDGTVRLTVTDTGRGIAAADCERLFEAFEQGDGPSDGLGLGLYISRALADRLGAHIIVHSVLGEGSEFAVEFSPASLPTRTTNEVSRTG